MCLSFVVLLAFIVALIILAAKLSPTVNYYLKCLVVNGSIVLVSSISVPYAMMNIKDKRRNALFISRMLPYFRPLLGVSFDVEMACGVGVVGDTATEKYVFVCNHQSALDAWSMMHLLPHLGHTILLVKKELLYTGPVGWILWLMGAIFVDRAGGEKGRQSVNAACKLAKDSGANLWVFPEGTRNYKQDGSMLPFKKGAFHIALDTKMPIVPIVISQYDFIDHQKKTFDPGVAKIKILEPFSLEGYSKDNIEELITGVRDKMLAELSVMIEKKYQ